MNRMTRENQGKVAVIKLDRDVTNAIDLELIEDLAAALKEIRADDAIDALFLTSANEKFFSIGFDLPALVDLGRDDFSLFYRSFNRMCLDLFTLPKPTVAGICGHAIAGGCIVALFCDYRIISQGRKLMGVNEIKLGVPVPYPADCLLRFMAGDGHARELIDLGEFHPPERSLELGIVDRVVPAGEVFSQSLELAAQLGSNPGGVWKLIKRNRIEDLEKKIAARLEEKERLFVDLWYAPATRETLKAAIAKF